MTGDKGASNQLPEKRSASLDSALIVLAVTAFSYFVAFIYDCGYLRFFAVPIEFGEVSLHALLYLVVTMASFAGVLYATGVNLSKCFFPPTFSLTLVVRIRVFVSSILIASTLAWLLASGWRGWIAFLAVPCAFLVRGLIVPQFKYPSHKSYSDRIEADAGCWDNTWPIGWALDLVRRSSQRSLVIGCVAAALLVYSWPLGYYMARIQETFEIPETDQPCAAIRLRTEGILCVGIDYQNHAVTGTLEFIDPKARRFHMMNLGRLNTRGNPIGPFAWPSKDSRGNAD